MRKFVSILIAIASVIGIAISFAGCNVEVTGGFYTLKTAYDNGWLDVDDVRSIACCYYDNYSLETNPYSGAYKEPTEKLSRTKQKELKKAYSNSTKYNNIKIHRYYGTYNGNIVVYIRDDDFKCDIAYQPELNIGGITFINFFPGYVNIYHPYEEKPPIDVRGSFYGLKQAYDNGWLSTDDLKSIACHYYDIYEYPENPYSGAYEEPTNLSKELEIEVKQAYLEQIADYPEGMLYDVDIFRYYGIYNGNVVAAISSRYKALDFTQEENEIGGITFDNLRRYDIRVYHIN